MIKHSFFPSFPVAILILHSAFSSAYGLRVVLQNAARFPFLMGSRLRRCCTILLHVIGMGGFAFHLDYLVEMLNNFRHKFGRRLSNEVGSPSRPRTRASRPGSNNGKKGMDDVTKASDNDGDDGDDHREKANNNNNNNNNNSEVDILDFSESPLGRWKQRHLNAMQMIQAFGESLPQFMLQTAAAFLDWTSGTANQCFPGTSGVKF